MTVSGWVSIIVAALSLSGSIILWALTTYFTNRREARTRSAEVHKRFLEGQIEEFYGPLLAISQRRHAIYEIRQRLLTAFKDDTEKRLAIRRFIRENYFEKLNMEIEEILTRKLHLLEDAKMPDSFRSFLTHAIQTDLQARLWTDEHIDNQVVSGTSFPPTFSTDVAATFSLLMTEYRSIQGRK